MITIVCRILPKKASLLGRREKREESSLSMVSKVLVGLLLNQVIFLPCLYTAQSYTSSPPSVYHDLRGELRNIIMYAGACTSLSLLAFAEFAR